MKPRFLPLFFITFLAALGCPAVSAPIRISNMKAVVFDKWGFQFEVPKPAEKYSISAQAEAELSELYIYDGLVYFVRVIKMPSDQLTSTVIEQRIQSLIKFSPAQIRPRRWELDANQNVLFKGLSHIVELSRDLPAEAPYIKRIVKSDTAFESASMAPLGGDSSPIIVVGVIGPSRRDSEIETRAKYAANNVRKIEKPAPLSVNSAQEIPPAPVTLPDNPAPAPTIKPVATEVHLRKGEIELLGIVGSLTSDNKSIVMVVDQITLPKSEPIKLEPARSKTVFVKAIPPGLQAGTRIMVIGKNTGVGKPMNADMLKTANN